VKATADPSWVEGVAAGDFDEGVEECVDTAEDHCTLFNLEEVVPQEDRESAALPLPRVELPEPIEAGAIVVGELICPPSSLMVGEVVCPIAGTAGYVRELSSRAVINTTMSVPACNEDAISLRTRGHSKAYHRDIDPVIVERHRRVRKPLPFVRALTEEVKCKLGRPHRSEANTMAIRRLVEARCKENKVRPKDTYQAVTIVTELVYATHVAEVNAAILRNSWTVRKQQAVLVYQSRSVLYRAFVPLGVAVWLGAVFASSSGTASG